MLCNTQQLMITSSRFSILWSRQFRRNLHLAFKIPKARSTATYAEDKNLLNLFCSWEKFKLSGNGFKSQVFAGYAPSPIKKGLILYPSITSVGWVRKMLLSPWRYNAESLRIPVSLISVRLKSKRHCINTINFYLHGQIHGHLCWETLTILKEHCAMQWLRQR